MAGADQLMGRGQQSTPVQILYGDLPRIQADVLTQDSYKPEWWPGGQDLTDEDFSKYLLLHNGYYEDSMDGYSGTHDWIVRCQALPEKWTAVAKRLSQSDLLQAVTNSREMLEQVKKIDNGLLQPITLEPQVRNGQAFVKPISVNPMTANAIPDQLSLTVQVQAAAIEYLTFPTEAKWYYAPMWLSQKEQTKRPGRLVYLSSNTINSTIYGSCEID